MLTEDEARTKWCPFARRKDWTAEDGAGIPLNATATNRAGNGAPRSGPPCIASDCMAWRWTSEGIGARPVEVFRQAKGVVFTMPPRPGFRWLPGENDEHDALTWGLFPRTGFCGLASRP